MKYRSLFSIALLLAVTACNKESEVKSAEEHVVVESDKSSISISSPSEGDAYDSKSEIQVNYEVTIAGDGDHAHLYVDDRRLAMLRKMKGSYVVFPQDPGIRHICIKVVNSNHTPIGISKCVKVRVE